MSNSDEVTLHLQIDGMNCASCSAKVKRALEAVHGVERAEVDSVGGTGRVVCSKPVAVDRLIEALRGAGYDGHLARQGGRRREEGDASDARWRFLLAASLSLPFVVEMVGMVTGHHHWIPPSLQAVLATLIQFLVAPPIYRSAWRVFCHGGANMDTLIALGSSVAYLSSLFSWVTGSDQALYFEGSALIITFVYLGRWLEERSKSRAADAIRELFRLQPTVARRITDSKVEKVPLEQVVIRDRLQLLQGDHVPVDGAVVTGRCSVDEALLSGESVPVTKNVGDSVYAGTSVLEGSAEILAEKVGSQTALAAIQQLVEEVQSSKPASQRLADQVVGRFVPVVVLVACAAMVLSLGYGWREAIYRATAVLVIACPCALGLATPIVVVVASGLAAKLGLLFRSADSLERVSQLTAVVFDKTGTLTEGRPSVVAMESGDPERDLKVVASLERHSNHPFAQALLEYAQTKEVIPLEANQVQTEIGRGVKGTVENVVYWLGASSWAEEQGVSLPSSAAKGDPLVILWNSSGICAYFTLRDPVKSSSRDAVAALSQLGLRVAMLTGDRAQVAERVARDVGVDEWRAEQLPDEKLAYLRSLLHKGERVGMVGDGINDAPALSAATVGFAIGAGADVAKAASDVTIVGGNPYQVVQAMRLAQATRVKMRQNLFLAFGYNVVAIPIAALGLLNPALAALAMSLSSVSVVSNALLLRSHTKSII